MANAMTNRLRGGFISGESGIMYGWEIYNGRGNMIPMGRPDFETFFYMKMVGLVLWLTR